MTQPTYRWTCITKAAAFAPRDGAGALVHRGRMWLLGGWNPRDKVNFPRICNSEVWCSEDGATWERVLAQAPWEGRHAAGHVVFQDRMFVIGGDANQGHYQPDVWSTADGIQWECENADVPWGRRALHHSMVHAGQIWVMGGQSMPLFVPGEGEVFHRDVWTSRDGRRWNCIQNPAPWIARGMIGGAAVKDGRIWLLGGGTYDTPQTRQRLFFNDVWSTANGFHWENPVKMAPWAPRQYHEVAVWDDRIWVLEGYHPLTGNRSDVWHSADGVQWTELPNTPWPARHGASVFVHQDALWMVAGNNMTSDVWRLDRV